MSQPTCCRTSADFWDWQLRRLPRRESDVFYHRTASVVAPASVRTAPGHLPPASSPPAASTPQVAEPYGIWGGLSVERMAVLRNRSERQKVRVAVATRLTPTRDRTRQNPAGAELRPASLRYQLVIVRGRRHRPLLTLLTTDASVVSTIRATDAALTTAVGH